MNRVAIIVAMTDDCVNFDANIARFVEEAGPGGEVILVTTQPVRPMADVRLFRLPPATLVPDLWRYGLIATSAPLVAFTTAAMRPDRGWLASLNRALESSDHAGVGGPIEPAGSLSMTDRAVALLRYSNYFPPLPDPSRVAPPGENALYRRDRLVDVGSAWADGFWEVAVHQALRDQGHSLTMDETAGVTFEGGSNLADMIRRRFAHARNYARFRSDGLGQGGRIARVILAPMIPPLLAIRALSALRARRRSILPYLASLPSFLILATAWSLGEAFGTCAGLRKSMSFARTSGDVNLRACKDQS